MFMVFDSIFGIFRWSTSLGWSNLRLGRWFGLGQGHFFWTGLYLRSSLSQYHSTGEGLSVNRHKSFRRSVATLGRPLEQLQSSSYQREEEVQFMSAVRTYWYTIHRRTGFSGPILPTCPKLFTSFLKWKSSLSIFVARKIYMNLSSNKNWHRQFSF